MFTTLSDLLSRRAPKDSVALIDRSRIVTALALEDESRRVARGLLELGVRKGDRVALWLPNVTAWLACLFACARIEAVVVSVNTRFRSMELQDILGRSGARVLVFWPGFRGIDFEGILNDIDAGSLHTLSSIVAYTEGTELLPARIVGHAPVRYETLAATTPLNEHHVNPESGVILFTTSGTTRAPKFVLHTQRAIAGHAGHVARAFGFEAADARILLTIPLCGTFGLTAALGALAAGRPLVMMPTFEARTAAELISRHAVTHFPAAGDIVAQLLALSSEERPYPSVRLVVGVRTGQAAPAQARGLCLVGVYGSSEVQAMVSRHSESAAPEQRELGGGTLVARDASVRARDAASGGILPHGQSGELEFRMPSQMVGYFDDEDATRAAMTEDGYVRSGDLGYTVEGGGFVFLARIGDALRLSGFLVNPLEIEAVLNEHPAIETSQVVGVEGVRGTEAVAFAVLKAGAKVDEHALIAHCARRIARFKVPSRVLAVDAFPVTHSANGTKIQKAKLREMAVEMMTETENAGISSSKTF
ncbi:MAG: AMP-binding protein [Burkholderiales bacterium]